VQTEEAGGVTQNCATLRGSFVGNGEDTHYYFEWGTDGSYGHQLPLTPGTDAGSPVGPAPTSASALLCGLAPSTEYHYRLVAYNSAGESRGEDRAFATRPAVAQLVTENPTEVTYSSATLHGSFVGNGEETHYYFEWAAEGQAMQRAPLP